MKELVTIVARLEAPKPKRQHGCEGTICRCNHCVGRPCIRPGTGCTVCFSGIIT